MRQVVVVSRKMDPPIGQGQCVVTRVALIPVTHDSPLARISFAKRFTDEVRREFTTEFVEFQGATWSYEIKDLDLPILDTLGQASQNLAIRFHDVYENLAPDYGYETRPETRVFDATSPNGELMIAVCRQLLTEGIFSLEPSE